MTLPTVTGTPNNDYDDDGNASCTCTFSSVALISSLAVSATINAVLIAIIIIIVLGKRHIIKVLLSYKNNNTK